MKTSVATVFLFALCLAPTTWGFPSKENAAPMVLKNCTQQRIHPGGQKATTVLDRFVLFSLATTYDAPDAGHVDIFDAETKAWSTTKLSSGRTNICSTNYKELAIFAGGGPHRGMAKSRSVDVYNTTSKMWALQQMTIGRDLLACASQGDYTLFAGGSAPQVNQSETAEVDIWNHVTGAWTTAKLSQPRKKPEAVPVGTKIVIAGGEIAKPGSSRHLLDYSATVDIFDAKDASWTTAKLSSPRQYFGATFATPSLAVFAGGFWDDVRLNVVDMYDAVEGTWTIGTPLSVNRSNLEGANVGGRFAAFGSGNIHPDAKLAFDVFDGVTGKWATSHGHSPDNTMVAGVRNVAFFANTDGLVDAIALDGDCSSIP